jgi:sacsin
MEFGETLSPTAAISSILAAYPFSVGLLRELLQNSDDAKASKQVRASAQAIWILMITLAQQIFVLDSRTHPTGSLYHHELVDAQGPALLACNDALFSETDWEAVQTIYESSKTTDTS